MATIKVNYFNTQDNKRTSTTFSEITVRFFLAEWYDEKDWLELNPHKMSYRNESELQTKFQQGINEMIDYFDLEYQRKGVKGNFWNKTLLEYYIMTIINKDWPEVNPDKMSYRNDNNAKTKFQQGINKMIEHFDLEYRLKRFIG